MKHLAWIVLLVAATAHADSLMVSPGALAAPHRALEEACDKCHVPFRGVPAESCLACHDHARQQVATKHGFHASTAGTPCGSCHSDHKGGDHVPTPALGAKFDHRVAGYALEGAHGKTSCASCHKAAPRWTGAPTTCVACHADTHHKGAVGTTCADCHTSVDWKPIAHHGEPGALSLAGGHAPLPCTSCHASGKNLRPKSACGDCHEQKHGGTSAPCASCHNVSSWKDATFTHDFCSCILPGKHQTAPCLACHPAFKFNPTPFACAGCHKKDLAHEPLGACSICHSALSWKTKAFNHNKATFHFPITGKHLEIGCENCHKTPRVFTGAPTACAGCHAVPKHGDFGACESCHTTSGWSATKFSHDRTRFPLDAQNAPVKCEICHKRFAPKTFVPGPNACGLCHGDPHEGQFHASLEARGANASAGVFVIAAAVVPHSSTGRACLDCHTKKSWVPSTIGVTEHASFRFPLRDAHARLPCASCHAGGRFVTTPTACNQCHLDRHRGRLGTACESCHDERSWRDVQGFDHARTGFALTDSHRDLTCASCHGEHHDKLARVRGPIGCATCHSTDKGHGAQFGPACTSCHKATTWSDVPPFDHTAKTDFPLERRHMTLKCLTCHTASKGTQLDRTCQTCHGDPHRGSNGADCAMCHEADRWRLVRFDHDRTEFPLYGRHFTVPCATCHRNPAWYSTRSECVACHAKDRPRTSDHASLIDCAQCHDSFSWRAVSK